MFSYEIQEDPIVIVIKDPNGQPNFHQPHHPDAENFSPWESLADAKSWAEEKVKEMNDILANPAPAPTNEQLIAELEVQLAALRAEQVD